MDDRSENEIPNRSPEPMSLNQSLHHQLCRSRRPALAPNPNPSPAQARWTIPFCCIIGSDTENLAYRACSLCEQALPDLGGSCPLCSLRTPSPPVKLLYRFLLSIATHDRAFVVISFDQAARTLLGCPAHDFIQFCSAHPGAARTAGQLLEGEMVRMILKASPEDNAEHQRVESVEPIRTEFQPIIHPLREIYSNGTDAATAVAAKEWLPGALTDIPLQEMPAIAPSPEQVLVESEDSGALTDIPLQEMPAIAPFPEQELEESVGSN